jgi:hypothetical protein
MRGWNVQIGGATEIEIQTIKCIQDQQCVRKSKTGELSCNHCYYEKAVRIVYSEYSCRPSYPACNAHAPYYIVICGFSSVCFHIIS